MILLQSLLAKKVMDPSNFRDGTRGVGDPGKRFYIFFGGLKIYLGWMKVKKGQFLVTKFVCDVRAP